MCPQYLWIDTPHAYGRTTLKFRFLMGIFKFSDPLYGGSNEVFGKNQNFPLFLNIKLHLKMPVNFNFLNILSFLGGSVPPLTSAKMCFFLLCHEKGNRVGIILVSFKEEKLWLETIHNNQRCSLQSSSIIVEKHYR